jgi:hypothetical protein
MKGENPKSEIRNPKVEGQRPGARGLRALDPGSMRAGDFGFRISDFLRISDFGFRIFPFALLACAATNNPDAIPALRPPRGEIPPGFWEKHGLLTVACSLLGLALVGLAGWFLARRKPVAVPAPEMLARQALEPLRRQREEGAVLSRVSHILRHYLIAAFGLPPEELTRSEFCRLLGGSQEVGPELAGAVAEFLRRCDERKFAPSAPQPPLGAAEQALSLIQAAEQRLARLREAAPVAAGKDSR